MYEAGQTISNNRQLIAELEQAIRGATKKKPIPCSNPRLEKLDECTKRSQVLLSDLKQTLEAGPPDVADTAKIMAGATAEEQQLVLGAPAEVESCLAGNSNQAAAR
jgi:hypothetical protein